MRETNYTLFIFVFVCIVVILVTGVTLLVHLWNRDTAEFFRMRMEEQLTSNRPTTRSAVSHVTSKEASCSSLEYFGLMIGRSESAHMITVLVVCP